MTSNNDTPVEQGGSYSKPNLRFLALGDSYTIGESVQESDRWPNQLARKLKRELPNLESPRIIARTGWTTGELFAGIADAAPSGNFELVSLLIGVNNQYRGLDLQEFATELDELIVLAIRLAGASPSRVIVLSIPDWSVTPFAADRDRSALAAEIERFNQCLLEMTNRHRCIYIDITPASRQADQDTSLLAADGLHPSASMYKRWSDLVYPVAREVLFEGTDHDG